MQEKLSYALSFLLCACIATVIFLSQTEDQINNQQNANQSSVDVTPSPSSFSNVEVIYNPTPTPNTFGKYSAERSRLKQIEIESGIDWSKYEITESPSEITIDWDKYYPSLNTENKTRETDAISNNGNFIGVLSRNENNRSLSKYDSNSVSNPYGTYGSPYSSYSATNPYTTEAPKLYDSEGNYRGSEGAVNIIYRNKLKTEADRLTAIEGYKQAFANPYKAAELGYIDEIIMPRETRLKIIQALDMTRTKIKSNPPKKHGNIPL